MQQEEFRGPLGGPSAEWAWVARPGDKILLRGAILLVHGFGIAPRCYSALCLGLAERGFAMIVPNIYGLTEPVGVEPKRIREWSVRVGMAFEAPLILAGHSRGGQAVMLSQVQDLESPRISPRVHAVILLDAVEGSPNIFGGLRPHLLRNGVREWRLDVSIPVLVIGAKLGTRERFSAAPPGHNYEAIWTDGLLAYCKANRPPSLEPAVPMWKVVAEDFGHLDYLNSDEDCEGLILKLARCVVTSGRDGRVLFRAFVILIASEFLNACAIPQPSPVSVEQWRSRVESLRLQKHVQFHAVGDVDAASGPCRSLVTVRSTSWAMQHELEYAR